MTPRRADTLDGPTELTPGRPGSVVSDDTQTCVAAATNQFERMQTLEDEAPPLENEALPPGTMLGDYRIEGEIGRGAMGIVYRTIHPVIGKRAAVKVLRRSLCESKVNVQRFVDEARLVNRIAHPNIVDVFAIGVTTCGCSYLVMECLEGESLRARLSRARFGPHETLQVIRPLVAALRAAHDQGVIHRDLKPDNIFLAETRNSRVVKLLDFGVAKLASDDGRLDLTATGELIGTPQYIAPEQARTGTTDHRADIYSLGCIWYEMLTGRPPFSSRNPAQLVTQHVLELPKRVIERAPHVPAELDALVMRMLEKRPEDRPTLSEVAAALHGTSPSLPALPRRGVPRGLLWLASAALCAASGAATFFVVSQLL